ncbi:uncharacterized protein LOC111612457 [Centruroides sculpturatus]|uniref:uncharacterized protein LOC111612457 n=1 Tax=Centruroides sculpturatus TaxID=218467 RepID=UPI000C6EB758|nr:uncharacterized protein LOC111612457 [Centruroides sculpturatus]
MLSECTEFFAHLENRNLLLCVALSFFTVAQQAIRKLEKVENQLRMLSGESMNSSLVRKFAQIQQEIEDIVNPALQEGRSLLEKVDRYDKGSQGVVRKNENTVALRKPLYHILIVYSIKSTIGRLGGWFSNTFALWELRGPLLAKSLRVRPGQKWGGQVVRDGA